MANFCIYCGKSLPDNALFCSGCGKNVEVVSDEQGTYEKLAPDDSIIESLEMCKKTFATVQEKYDIRNNLQYSLSTKVNYFILFVVFIVVGFVLGNALDFTFWEMGIQWLGVSFCWFGIGIICPLLITLRIKKNEQNDMKLLATINAELEENYRTKNLPIKLAFEYSDPRIIDILIGILRQGRADNLKEAINCLLDDQYKSGVSKTNKAISNSAEAQALLALGIILCLDD